MDSCPACSGHSVPKIINSVAVNVCTRCGAIHGTVLLGDSYAIVKPHFEDPSVTVDDETYFDFITIGSGDILRRHGWFNPKTGLITQVG